MRDSGDLNQINSHVRCDKWSDSGYSEGRAHVILLHSERCGEKRRVYDADKTWQLEGTDLVSTEMEKLDREQVLGKRCSTLEILKFSKGRYQVEN